MNNYTNYQKMVNGLKQSNGIDMVHTIPVHLLGTVKAMKIFYNVGTKNTGDPKEDKKTAEIGKKLNLLKPNVVYLCSWTFGGQLHWFTPFTYNSYLIMGKQVDKDQSKNQD